MVGCVDDGLILPRPEPVDTSSELSNDSKLSRVILMGRLIPSHDGKARMEIVVQDCPRSNAGISTTLTSNSTSRSTTLLSVP